LLPALCGDFPVVFVPGSERRSRAVAANAGLDAAHGQYIGFLDDDDLIESTHVAGLVAALEANPEYGVAYAHAREIDTDGALIRRRSERYSRFVLFQECFIQPSAVLFRRAIRDCCRFDERFEVCEDWDFWLQAATMTDFLEVPQETAIYRSALGRSGTGQGPNRDLSQFRRFHALIAAKWHAEGARLAGVVLPARD